jgi:hypothetical protein
MHVYQGDLPLDLTHIFYILRNILSTEQDLAGLDAVRKIADRFQSEFLVTIQSIAEIAFGPPLISQART